jgi:hypothetical protein
VAPEVATYIERNIHAPVTPASGQVTRTIQRVDAEFQNHTDLSPMIMEGLGLELADRAAQALADPDRRAPRWLTTARDLIRDSGNASLRVKDIAEEAGVHPIRLARDSSASNSIRGDRAQVTIPVGRRELSYWSTTEHSWVVVTGIRTIEVGASSRDLRLKTPIDIVSKETERPSWALPHLGCRSAQDVTSGLDSCCVRPVSGNVVVHIQVAKLV